MTSMQKLTHHEARVFSSKVPDKWYTAYDVGIHLTQKSLTWVEATQRMLNSLAAKGKVERRAKDRQNKNDFR